MEALLDRPIGIEKYFSYIVIKSPILRHAAPLQKAACGGNKTP